MKENEILEKLKKIIFSVPDEIYKYKKPDNCFQEEWDGGTPEEKAFYLTRSVLIDHNIELMEQKENEADSVELEVINLGNGPRFYSTADEDMFFNAIYSLPSFYKIKGEGRRLILYYKPPIMKEEKEYLRNLFKRFQMEVPEELKASK